MAVDCGGDVRVVAFIEGEIPVAAIEANAVGEDLEGVPRAGFWLAVGRSELVSASDGVIL